MLRMIDLVWLIWYGLVGLDLLLLVISGLADLLYSRIWLAWLA